MIDEVIIFQNPKSELSHSYLVKDWKLLWEPISQNPYILHPNRPMFVYLRSLRQ